MKHTETDLEAILNDVEQEIEEEKKKAIKEEPYYLGDLADKGYKTDGTGVYAPYNPPYYLKLGKEDEKTFTFTWSVKQKDNTFKLKGQTCSKQKPITETDPSRNRTIGYQSKILNLPRCERKVADFIAIVGNTIQEFEGLEILKNKHFYPEENEIAEEEEMDDSSSTPQTYEDYPDNIRKMAKKVRLEGNLLERIKKTTSYRLEGNEKEVKLTNYAVAGLFCGGGVNILAG